MNLLSQISGQRGADCPRRSLARGTAVEQVPNRDWKGKLKRQAAVLGAFVVIIWVVEIVDQAVFGGKLDQWGIRPRSIEGLPGIALAPFLHGSFAHVAANTMPFFAL